jgi:hypothetical protein
MLSIRKTPRPFARRTSGTDRGCDRRYVNPPPSGTSTETSLLDTHAETRIMSPAPRAWLTALMEAAFAARTSP